MVHAGIHPHWTQEEALGRSEVFGRLLRSENWRGFLKEIYASYSSELRVYKETLEVLTRIRMCSLDGNPEFNYKRSLEEAPASLKPWFHFSNYHFWKHTIIFGHWAALGLRLEDKIISLDTGCVWGRNLTALRLEDQNIFQVPFAD